MNRLAEAQAYSDAGDRRVATTPAPKKQKFPVGAKVRIADDLGLCMSHFPGKGCEATVLHTYAHAYGGNDIDSYGLDIDEYGKVYWYHEDQLTLMGYR